MDEQNYYEKNICDGWEFSKNPIDTPYSNQLNWKKISIPHDWLIYDTNNLYETSTGWYRRKINISKKVGERYSLRFEGIYMDSRIYINDQPAAQWKYGYSTFETDITQFLKDGENLISVCVDFKEPNSRWYSGAGIYRKVLLKKYPDRHINSDGVYISADINGNTIISTETVRPADKTVDGMSVRHTIFYNDNEIIKSEYPCCACDESVIPAAVREQDVKYSLNTVTLKIPQPQLWDIDNPNLYLCVTQLLFNGEVIHSVSNKFGFKKMEFTTDKGFFLNNRQVKIHGCCEHHDLGALGAAVNKSAIKRKLVKLREIGINAIRTSHNMPAVELMELADEMGFLILSEAFDMWEMPKTTYDYGRFFKTWVDKDVASWIRRDRNHPCIIGWSVGNEIYDTHANEHGQEIISMLKNLVEQHDYRKNAPVTLGSNYMQGENGQKCADIVKLIGYNYAERLYDSQHQNYPDWMIYGSETSSVVQSRGIYHFPYSEEILSEDDEQCSALGNSTPGWAARSTEECIIPDRDREFCAGQFIWTGFDYIGEPTPYSTKNSYFGQFDTAGFVKDSAYIFKGAWTDYKKSPFVHIYPYWDFMEGQDIDVRVATNAPKVKLFLNDELAAQKEFDLKHGKELTLNCKLKYTKGKLTAIAYDEKDNEIARCVNQSFGDAAQIRLTAENDTIRANSDDLIFLEISAFDKDGVHTANANNRVFVEVTGAGRLVGLDNGDSTDYEQYKGTSRRLFSGKLLAIIAAKDISGDINVKVTSPSLPDAKIVLKALENNAQEGFCCLEENSYTKPQCPDDKIDIPVRKICFESTSRTFTADCREIDFKTVVYPKNAIYGNEIEYRIATDSGITSNLAKIVSNEDGVVRVRCLGDGEFCLRAVCKNGTSRKHILTSLKLKGEGIGSAFFDPYDLVAGGLYTKQNGSIHNGIQQGVSFTNVPGWFAFENVDFGKIGSDEITLPIFANCTTPVNIRIYDGLPNSGGELIGDFSYHKTPEWLTYKAETYKLSKKLKGIHTISFESSNGYDIKGFYFTKFEKEFSEISAVDADNIYGDSFTVDNDLVKDIGNNVILDFGEFDFSKDVPSKIIITGSSDLPCNSINLIFTSQTEQRILIEFSESKQYSSKEFSVNGLNGKGKISFAFLPGSKFNFKSFKFCK